MKTWIRSLHFYTSTLLFGLVLFYGFTGFLANRRQALAAWVGLPPAHEQVGPYPFDLALTRDGVVQWGQREHLPPLTTWAETVASVSAAFGSVGEDATCTIDRTTRTVHLSRHRLTWVDALANLHESVNSRPWQRALTDATGLLLVVVSLTGMLTGLVGMPTPRRRVAWILLIASGLLVALLVAAR